MRIGMIAQRLSRLNGGVSEAVRLSCEALVTAGAGDMQLFCTRDEHLEEDIRAFPPMPLHAARAFGTPRFGLAPGQVADLLAARLDVLHVHGVWTSHALAAWVWHRVTGRPLIVSPHGMLEGWILARSPRQKAAVRALYLDDLLRRAAAIPVLTDKEAGDVRAVLPGLRPAVVPHYVPARAGMGQGARPPAWWTADMAGRTVLLFFGRIHEKKGVRELLAGWERFTMQAPDVARTCELVFCGWNDGVEGFEAGVSQLRERFGNIRFAGPQYGDEKWNSIDAAHFMLLPSHSEGVPMAILEGWSAGLPAIMTDACNLPEGFAAGAAIRVEPRPEAIHEALVAAATMAPSRYEAMRNAAQALVLERFSARAFASRTLAMYETAQRQSGKTGREA